MTNRDEILGNRKHDNSKYCLTKNGEISLVYLPKGDSTAIDLPPGDFFLAWFNPRDGELAASDDLAGYELTAPRTHDWLALICRK